MSGERFASILLAGFAFVWATLGTRSLPEPWRRLVLLVASGLSLTVVLLALRMPHPSGGFANTGAEPSWRLYIVCVAFEALAIPLTVAVLRRRGRVDLILSSVALIVGLHFLPLISAFHSPAFGWTGGLMCATAVIGLALPSPKAHGLDGRNLFVGLACAAILWGSCATWIVR